MSAAIRIVLFARSAIYFAFLVVTVIPYAVAVLLWTYFAGRLLTASIATNASLWRRRHAAAAQAQ